MADLPPGYRFVRIVIIIGATGFTILGAFYLLSGQVVPGLFALFVALIEAAALPLFRKLFESSRTNQEGKPGQGP